MSENYFETKESRERADYILGTLNCSDLLNEQTEASVLDEFFMSGKYNWDDGLEVPYFVLKHRNCELGTALNIFYLAEGADLLEPGYEEYTLGHWVEFVEFAYKRIAKGKYCSKSVSFQFPLMESVREELKKAGWAEFFTKDIVV